MVDFCSFLFKLLRVPEMPSEQLYLITYDSRSMVLVSELALTSFLIGRLSVLCRMDAPHHDLLNALVIANLLLLLRELYN